MKEDTFLIRGWLYYENSGERVKIIHERIHIVAEVTREDIKVLQRVYTAVDH